LQIYSSIIAVNTGRVESWRSTFRLSVALAIPFGDDASARLALSLFPAPPHQTENGVRVPRKSQLKSSSFFEAKLPLLPLERHFFEIDIKPT